MDVKFLRGLYSNYNAIGSKDQGTFYITGPNENSFDSIYLGSHLLGTTLASGIVLTGFNLGEGKESSADLSAADTVLTAIEKLDKALSNTAAANNVVTSFDGKVGAITLSEEGNVSLSTVGNALKAEIDLSSYVTSESLTGTLANYQPALSAGRYIDIDESNNIATVQGSFATAEAELRQGLATVEAVEAYVESQITAVESYVETQIAANVLVWGTIE